LSLIFTYLFGFIIILGLLFCCATLTSLFFVQVFFAKQYLSLLLQLLRDDA